MYIEVKGVAKSFKKKEVLRDINLEIPQGKIYGIIGENGSGKTTLLNILIGFLKPSSGSILYQSVDINKELLDVEKHFGFATQDNAFYGYLTVEENLKYFGNLYSIPKKELDERIKKLLDLVELSDAKNVLGYALSSGMKRRLDIACSMIHKPSVLILDEPTEELDPYLRKEIITLIKRINQDGTTIILTSHLLKEVEEFCDLVAIFHKGKIYKVGTPDQLKSEYSKSMIITLELASKKYGEFIKKLKKNNRISDVSIEGNRALIFSSDGIKLMDTIIVFSKRYKETINYLSLDRPSLDLIFDSIILGDKNVKNI